MKYRYASNLTTAESLIRKAEKLLGSYYTPPYNIDDIKKNYPQLTKELLNDPIHLWRAKTGIELIHKEPTKEELIRIWDNWNQMSDRMKKISDVKSMKLFGIDNTTHYKKLMKEL